MADNDIGVYGTEIFNDEFAELRARAPGLVTLEQRDIGAVISAIAKAAWRGILRGLAMQAQLVNEKLREDAGETGEEPLQIDVNLQVDPEPDLWAQSYGGEA